jgi:hypothetical protein
MLSYLLQLQVQILSDVCLKYLEFQVLQAVVNE